MRFPLKEVGPMSENYMFSSFVSFGFSVPPGRPGEKRTEREAEKKRVGEKH
jgi:hypothetical protein